MTRHSVKSLAARIGAHVLVLVSCAAPLAAQAQPALEMPLPYLRAIAGDVDAARNPIYCYHGVSNRSPAPLIHVDSVSSVATMSACHGIGIGFISRVDDPASLADVLRDLILANPEFQVVSAFYRTELADVAGERCRIARALSVIRGAAVVAAEAQAPGQIK